MTTIPKPEPAPAPPLPPDNPVQLWLTALRDGVYNQGYFYLMQRPDADAGELERQFCCLGVACEISGLGEWDDSSDTKHCYHVAAAAVDAIDILDGGAPGTIPEGVRTWVGLRTPLGEFWVTREWLDAFYEVAPDAADKVAMHISELRTDGKLDDDVDGEGAPVTLAGLNDAAGLSFSEIAAVVESDPPGLFE